MIMKFRIWNKRSGSRTAQIVATCAVGSANSSCCVVIPGTGRPRPGGGGAENAVDSATSLASRDRVRPISKLEHIAGY